jgi:glucosamine--fructose-6-phosphate aminotransferase (isomerizing)
LVRRQCRRGRDRLGGAAESCRGLAGAGRAKKSRLAELSRERRSVACVGVCSSLGTADGASLMIREAARIPAGAAVVILGDDHEVELARQLDEIGYPVLLVTAHRG